MTAVAAAATSTAIPGLLQLHPKAISDARGTVRELFRASAFPVELPRWVQMNLTYTVQGAVRGLHGEQMTKLIGVVSGTAFGAYLDTRPESPAYGTVITVNLTVGTQILVPPGVCNGFQATSAGGCEYLYCFDTEWAPDLRGVAVNPLDPALGIDWPLPPQLSEKDAAAPLFAELVRR